MVDEFAKYGVTKEMLKSRIGRSLESIEAAQVINLRKIYASLKDDISAVSDWFPVAEAKSAASAAEELLAKEVEPEKAPAEVKQEELPIVNQEPEISIVGLDGETRLYPSQINMETIADITKVCYEHEHEDQSLTTFFKNNKKVMPKILEEMAKSEDRNSKVWAVNLKSIFEESN